MSEIGEVVGAILLLALIGLIVILTGGFIVYTTFLILGAVGITNPALALAVFGAGFVGCVIVGALTALMFE